MRILYLDFDGVLNSDAYFAASSGLRLSAHGATHIDPAALPHLDRILVESGAAVVVSSSWRECYSLEQLRAFLADRGMVHVERLLDRTGESWLYRGEEIRAHVDSLIPPPDGFAILDDDREAGFERGVGYRGPLAERFVRTKSIRGLTEHEVPHVIRLLGLPLPDVMRRIA